MLGREYAKAQSPAPSPDIQIRIAEMTLELGPKRLVRTLAYNGQVPGPLLRVREGTTFTVDVSNESGAHELVHWHGLHIGSEVDGAHEEGTPPVMAHSSRRYTFRAEPAGTRWYHSHAMAGHDLRAATYSGQFGVFIVEPLANPGRYDADIPIVMHEWDGRVQQEDVEYRLFSINGKMLGFGEPIRVRRGDRALLRLVNASATMTHRLSLTGHTLEVIALDGNPVAKPGKVRSVEMGPGERVDAIVAMDNPGVWILGSLDDRYRASGMGIVVEYADQKEAPRWVPPPPSAWDYLAFGPAEPSPDADGHATLIKLEFKPKGDRWTINGKSFPHTDPIQVRTGGRYRLRFDNQSSSAHPVHLHRHTFELKQFAGRATSGVHKDVVIVPAWQPVEVELIASNPGPTLFHCHHQHHMDMGFMALMQYET